MQKKVLFKSRDYARSHADIDRVTTAGLLALKMKIGLQTRYAAKVWWYLCLEKRLSDSYFDLSDAFAVDNLSE